MHKRIEVLQEHGSPKKTVFEEPRRIKPLFPISHRQVLENKKHKQAIDFQPAQEHGAGKNPLAGIGDPAEVGQGADGSESRTHVSHGGCRTGKGAGGVDSQSRQQGG